MRDEDDVGLRAGHDGRERAACPRREHIGHLHGARGKVTAAELLKPLDAALPSPWRPVAAFREDHQGPGLIQPVRQPLDLLGVEPLAGPAMVDEYVGQPVGQHIDARIELHGGLHHDPRPALVHSPQMVHEQERIAWPGMAAEHDDRAVQPGRLLGAGELRLDDLDPDPEGAGGTAVHPVKEPAHDRVVPALVGLGAQPPAEAARHPQAQASEQRDRFGAEPDQGEVQQPHAAHPARARPAEQPEDQREQREQREEKRDGDGDDDRERREHKPAHQPGWEHGRLLSSCGSVPGQLGEIAGGRGIRPLDTGSDLSLVAVFQLA